jgi:hypothetical protein
MNENDLPVGEEQKQSVEKVVHVVIADVVEELRQGNKEEQHLNECVFEGLQQF